VSKQYNFQIERGSTKVVTVNYTDANNDVKDLTNYAARLHLRTKPSASTPVLELNSSGSTVNKSCLYLTPVSGSIQIYISAGDTDLLTESVYFYDLEIYTSQDPFSKADPEYVERLIEGTIITRYNITK